MIGYTARLFFLKFFFISNWKTNNILLVIILRIAKN